jgi:acetyl-CoA decarbonylase/synthase complex subunit gamma
MALKGLDIFKLTPKTNCKECDNPTCMAFAMKVAAGTQPVSDCPHMSPEALAKLASATQPPMVTIEVGVGDNAAKLGGETVLLRHEKLLVNKNLYGVFVSAESKDADIDALLADTLKIDYERIAERMTVQSVLVKCSSDAARSIAVAKKVIATGRILVLESTDPAVAKAVVEATKEAKPVLIGANASNFEAFNAIAKAAGIVLGVSGKDLNELHETIEKLEAAGNKNLIIDLGTASIKEAFANAVLTRRAAIKDGDHSFGYPSFVNVAALTPGDLVCQAALAALFTLRYGSIIIMERIGFAEALPLMGLRQNIFTDPQKPMRVTPGIYPLCGANETSVCALTVDFALSYFVVSGEIERSKIPVNLLIPDAGGMSVLTAWAAGKLSSATIAKYIQEFEVETKIKNHTLILPGKVAVLKGDLEGKLPGWNIVVGPNEAIQLVKFLRDFKSVAQASA